VLIGGIEGRERERALAIRMLGSSLRMAGKDKPKPGLIS
jgi:hypothetical protein